ncbi:phytanoyl-CoA dioxygenase family protein [Dapis sp. BLCC M229]|uniref:phytanoyl-CoA dioxygenase family protein n=1 Tax=Dapis sp. BLCC M229 TaxID=3400188 RepID=UPI003CEDAA26
MLTDNNFNIASPGGIEISIPVTIDEESDIYLKLKEPSEIQNYYQENGYVVFRNLIPEELCDRVKITFDQEIKTYQGYIYRQTTASPEKNKFTENGYVINPLLNIQDLRAKDFPNFKNAALSVITHNNIYDAVKTILGEEGILVQSMYFEGNSATAAHQDTYYLDSAEIGRMTAAWIAVEDIHPGAGRFYVYPGSHKIEMAKNSGDLDIAFNHSRYQDLVLKIIAEEKLECHAPALRKGDVLFWAARTIHGSLQTKNMEVSRCSFTSHFIPASTNFMLFQRQHKPLNLRKINSFNVHCPKDRDKLKNRAIFYLETRFPKAYQFAKNVAIKMLLG